MDDDNLKIDNVISEDLPVHEPFQHQVYYNIEVETDCEYIRHGDCEPPDSDEESDSPIPETENWNDADISEKLVKKFQMKSKKPDYYLTLIKEENEKRYSCLTCGSQFQSLRRLIKHKEGHAHSDPSRGKVCTFCHKTFKTEHLLKGHLKMHLGLREYRCQLCNKAFTQLSHLSNHLLTHTGEKRFTCEICDKKFKQSGHLLNHRRIHTGEKKFVCDICNKGFTQNVHLKSHHKIHTGTKDHLCIICNKLFKQSGHLQMHMRIHTGERKHQCPKCDMKFKQSGHLQSHLKTHGKPKLDRRKKAKENKREDQVVEYEIPLVDPLGDVEMIEEELESDTELQTQNQTSVELDETEESSDSSSCVELQETEKDRIIIVNGREGLFGTKSATNTKR